jgi:hypothetical protein
VDDLQRQLEFIKQELKKAIKHFPQLAMDHPEVYEQYGLHNEADL